MRKEEIPLLVVSDVQTPGWQGGVETATVASAVVSIPTVSAANSLFNLILMQV